jgi:hypothetical protein
LICGSNRLTDFDLRALSQLKCLRTMSYRATLVGGKLVAANGPNGGAVITCTVPLPAASAV